MVQHTASEAELLILNDSVGSISLDNLFQTVMLHFCQLKTASYDLLHSPLNNRTHLGKAGISAKLHFHWAQNNLLTKEMKTQTIKLQNTVDDKITLDELNRITQQQESM